MAKTFQKIPLVATCNKYEVLYMSFAVIMVIFKIFMILMVMAIIYAEKASRKRKHPVRLMRRKLVRLEPVGLLNISSPLHPEKDVFFFFSRDRFFGE